jgi:hypothetical protein
VRSLARGQRERESFPALQLDSLAGPLLVGLRMALAMQLAAGMVDE